MATEKQYDIAESEFDLEKIKSFETVDVADYLNSPEDLADYLSEFFAESDPAMIAAGLRTASRAVGMSEIAERSGLARESLYKAFRPGSQPRLETIVRVLDSLGMRLVVQPKSIDSEGDSIDNGSEGIGTTE
jgi:probable addiction module antidote protein